ncbi:hypothetical protein RUM43_001195, partial [Polyplax serrata]
LDAFDRIEIVRFDPPNLRVDKSHRHTSTSEWRGSVLAGTKLKENSCEFTKKKKLRRFHRGEYKFSRAQRFEFPLGNGKNCRKGRSYIANLGKKKKKLEKEGKTILRNAFCLHSGAIKKATSAQNIGKYKKTSRTALAVAMRTYNNHEKRSKLQNT